MDVPGVVVLVVLVAVAFVDIVDVARLIPVMFVGIALVNIVVMRLGMMFVVVAFVDIVDVARLIPVMFVGIALVNIVLLHYHRLRLLTSRSIVSASVPIADACFVYQYNLYFDTVQVKARAGQGLSVFKILIPSFPRKREPRGHLSRGLWIPAFAGMTKKGEPKGPGRWLSGIAMDVARRYTFARSKRYWRLVTPLGSEPLSQ